jgi:hypothetical protein
MMGHRVTRDSEHGRVECECGKRFFGWKEHGNHVEEIKKGGEKNANPAHRSQAQKAHPERIPHQP